MYNIRSTSWKDLYLSYSSVTNVTFRRPFHPKIHSLGGGFNLFFIFTPTWGRWTHLDEHIFQMGWFNHQLVTIYSSKKSVCPQLSASYLIVYFLRSCSGAISTVFIPMFFVSLTGDLTCVFSRPRQCLGLKVWSITKPWRRGSSLTR